MQAGKPPTTVGAQDFGTRSRVGLFCLCLCRRPPRSPSSRRGRRHRGLPAKPSPARGGRSTATWTQRATSGHRAREGGVSTLHGGFIACFECRIRSRSRGGARVNGGAFAAVASLANVLNTQARSLLYSPSPLLSPFLSPLPFSISLSPSPSQPFLLFATSLPSPLPSLSLCLLRCSVWLWLFLLVAGRCVLACCLADGPAAGPVGLPEGAPLLVLVVPGKAFGTVVWQQPEIPRHPTGPVAEQCDLEQEVVMATGLRCVWEHKFINL